MTAETDLLPPPEAEYRLSPDGKPCLHDSETLADYARACVSSATEALRAEVDEARTTLRAALDASTDGEPLRVLAIRASNALYWRTERAERAEARAERLAEALRDMLDEYGQLHAKFDLGECQATMNARAALEQEKGRG